MDELRDMPGPRQKVCFNCRLLSLREERGGQVMYWCARTHRVLSDARVWKPCANFKPLAEPLEEPGWGWS